MQRWEQDYEGGGSERLILGFKYISYFPTPMLPSLLQTFRSLPQLIPFLLQLRDCRVSLLSLTALPIPRPALPVPTNLLRLPSPSSLLNFTSFAPQKVKVEGEGVEMARRPSRGQVATWTIAPPRSGKHRNIAKSTRRAGYGGVFTLLGRQHLRSCDGSQNMRGGRRG